MSDELKIIKQFFHTLSNRCARYHVTGCACTNRCGMGEYCNRGLNLSDDAVEALYEIYLRDDSEYSEELELAKKLRSGGIDLKKLEELIEKIGELK